MRIDGWSITAFGPLVQWEVSDLARHNVLVVLGPNESGKSALFDFFVSAMFGFSPGRADRHPYRPWDGRFPEGRLHVTLRDGSQARVSRRLTSRPEGRLTVEDDTQALANHPVPWVGLLDRPVFKNVYALTQEEALGLGEQGWQVVQDLLGGSSFDFLRPSREVVDVLDAECRRLWRPSRHSQPKARQIMGRIAKLRDGLPASRRLRERIEINNARLSEIASELKANDYELQRMELALERDATLAPLIRRVEHMNNLRAQADGLVPIGLLPDDVPDQRDTLVARLEDLQELSGVLKGEIEQCQDELDISAPEHRLLAARDTIEGLGGDLSRAREDQGRAQSMDAELQRIAGALREVTGRVVASGQLDEAARDAILAIPVPELRGRLRISLEARRKLDAALEAVRVAESQRALLEQSLGVSESMPSRTQLDKRLRDLREIEAARELATVSPRTQPSVPLPLLVVIALGGVVAFAVGLGVGGLAGTLLAVGGAGMVVAAANVVATRRRSVSSPGVDWKSRLRRLDLGLDVDIEAEITQAQAMRDAALRRELDVERLARAHELEAAAQEAVREAEAVSRAAHADFLAVIADIPVAPIHREMPDEGLVRDMDELRQGIGNAQRIQGNRDDVGERLDQWCTAAESLREALEIGLPGDPFEAVQAAQRLLPDALESERIAKTAEAKLPELRQRLESCSQAWETAVAELERIDSALRGLDPVGVDPIAGLDCFQRGMQLRSEALQIHAVIERETPEWRARVSEAADLVARGELVGLTDEERVASRRRLKGLRARGQDLADDRGRRRAKRGRLDDEPGPAHIVGEIGAAEEQLMQVKEEHDRLALLRTIVQAAERSYRERYQAPLLSAAGHHLRHFTNERYDLLTVDRLASEATTLQVRRTGEEFPESVKTPLSRGTIQQIYFALRLAMVDLVEGDEPLPLFLDEMFVNWDPGRTSSGLTALANLPDNRQVFLFTADPYWAERAIEDVPALIVRTPAA